MKGGFWFEELYSTQPDHPFGFLGNKKSHQISMALKNRLWFYLLFFFLLQTVNLFIF